MATETEPKPRPSQTSPRGKSAICGWSGATPPDIPSTSRRRYSSSACRRRRPWRSPTASSASSTRASAPAGRAALAVGTAFKFLLVIVVVLAAATAMRFFFVSWIGERTVADLRIAVQKNLLTPAAALLRGEPAVGDRLAADRRHRDPRADRRLQRFDRACATSPPASAASLICFCSRPSSPGSW